MLEQRERKAKWPVNVGRQPLWANVYSKGLKFGKELMEKMGWKIGQGLGVNEQGISEPIHNIVKVDKKGMGVKVQDIENEIAQEFDEFLRKFSSSENARENVKEDGKNKIQSLEEKSRCSRGRVHYKKLLLGKDSANYTEKDWQCIFGYKKEPMKQDNKDHDEDETGLTVNAGSMADYFELKMQNRARLVGSDAAKKAELTKSVLGKCESSQEPVKKKKESKKKELLTELPHKNHSEEKVNYLTCDGDNCKKKIFKEKSTKRSELDVNLISHSQSDQTDSTALIKRPRNKVVFEFDGGTSDFTGAEYKSLRKEKKHKTQLEHQNIKHSEAELTVEKKRKKFCSSYGDETNSISDCSIPVQLLEQGNGEESTANEGDVRKQYAFRFKRKFCHMWDEAPQFYEINLENDDHNSETLMKGRPAESEECLAGNGREETNGDKKANYQKLDSDIYKIEVLKTNAKIIDSSISNMENLIQFRNVEKFKGSNLGLLKGYGITRCGTIISNRRSRRKKLGFYFLKKQRKF